MYTPPGPQQLPHFPPPPYPGPHPSLSPMGPTVHRPPAPPLHFRSTALPYAQRILTPGLAFEEALCSNPNDCFQPTPIPEPQLGLCGL